MYYSREDLAKELGISVNKISNNSSLLKSTEEYSLKIVFFATLKINPTTNESIDNDDLINLGRRRLTNNSSANDIFYDYIIQIKSKDYPNLQDLCKEIKERIELTRTNLNQIFKDQIIKDFSGYWVDINQ